MIYKVSYVTGNNVDIGRILNQEIEFINNKGGKIVNVVQSQSTGNSGIVIVTITIIYQVMRAL